MMVQVGDIPKRKHPEGRNPGAALLGRNGRHRTGRGAGIVPQHHRGDIQQMAEQHAAHPEMAEENQGV